MLHILIVDSDKSVCRYYSSLIKKSNFIPYIVDSAEEALLQIDKVSFDIVILDVDLSGMDGLTFIRMLRDSNITIPIMIVSSHKSHKDINQGLLSGADDYMTTPIDEQEFILRIKALCRRTQVAYQTSLTIGSTIIDQSTRMITTGNIKYVIPHKEFDLLFFLLSYPNHVFSREFLLGKVWGPMVESDVSTVSVHINRLRHHFYNNPDFDIVTVRGCGYKAMIKEHSEVE